MITLVFTDNAISLSTLHFSQITLELIYFNLQSEKVFKEYFLNQNEI